MLDPRIRTPPSWPAQEPGKRIRREVKESHKTIVQAGNRAAACDSLEPMENSRPPQPSVRWNLLQRSKPRRAEEPEVFVGAAIDGAVLARLLESQATAQGIAGEEQSPRREQAGTGGGEQAQRLILEVEADTAQIHQSPGSLEGQRGRIGRDEGARSRMRALPCQAEQAHAQIHADHAVCPRREKLEPSAGPAADFHHALEPAIPQEAIHRPLLRPVSVRCLQLALDIEHSCPPLGACTRMAVIESANAFARHLGLSQ